MFMGNKKSYGPKVKVAPYPGKGRSVLRTGFPKGVKRVIAVHSGKGGVGKTFVAVNLAVYLADRGFKVGLIDADIDCPNVMRVMGLEGKLIANSRKKIVPLEKFGVKVVSLAPMQTREDQSIMWRGPVISKAIEQFVHDTNWGKLDFLIVDLPPGTSDAPISVLNILKGAEVLIVTTPQQLAIVDARKAVNLAREMGARVIGLIENMSGEIFGGGAVKMAKLMKIPFLGSIELKAEYQRQLEKGRIPVLKDKSLQAIFGSIKIK